MVWGALTAVSCLTIWDEKAFPDISYLVVVVVGHIRLP